MSVEYLNPSASSMDFSTRKPSTTTDITITLTADAGNVQDVNGNVGTPSDARYTVTAGGGAFTLGPGGTRNVTVRFAPSAVGNYPATLDITHDASGSTSPITITIAGRCEDVYKYLSWTNRRNKAGDLFKVTMTATRNDGGVVAYNQTNVDGSTEGIHLKRLGEIEWAYDLENLLMFAGEWSVSFIDLNKTLHDVLYGGSYDPRAVVKLEVKYGGAGSYDTRYIGALSLDSMEWTEGLKGLNLDAVVRPRTDILQRIMVYDQNNAATDPITRTDNTWYLVTGYIEDCYKKVDAAVAVDITHDWVWKLKYGANEVTDGAFSELKQNAHELFYNSSRGIKNLGDVLRQLAIDWGCYTGMVHEQKAFFRRLFTTANTYTPTKVLSFRKRYQLPQIRWVRTYTAFTYNLAYENPSSAAYTTVEGETLEWNTLCGYYINPGVSEGSNVFSTRLWSGNRMDAFAVKDTSIDTTWRDHGAMVSKFWYTHRNNLKQCRVDEIAMQGLNYDPTHCPTYGGNTYQPIRVLQDLHEGTTTVEGIPIV